MRQTGEERCFILMDFDDAQTIGQRLRRIRKVRRKSLVVVPGLAGMSKSQLNRIKRVVGWPDSLCRICSEAPGGVSAPGGRCPVPGVECR